MPRHQTRRRSPAPDDLEKLQALAAAIADLAPDVLPGAERMLRDVRRAALPRQPSTWGRFFMMNQEQAVAVWEAIMTRPDIPRRHQVYRAFCVISAFVEQGTSEVLLDREELAKLIRCPVSNLSGIMASLKKLNVISRSERRRIPGVQGPGEVVYFVSPHVAWNGTLAEQERAARKTSPPSLKLVHSSQAAK